MFNFILEIFGMVIDLFMVYVEIKRNSMLVIKGLVLF